MTNPETVSQSEVVDVMRSQRIASLTTRTSAGKLVAHPMTVQEVTDDADVWLFLDGRSDHAEALRGDPAVTLAFSGSGSWLSVSGTAEFVDDRAKAEELWDGSVDAYFDGVDDPRATLLRIDSDSAQYWGVPGGAPRRARRGRQGKGHGPEAERPERHHGAVIPDHHSPPGQHPAGASTRGPVSR